MVVGRKGWLFADTVAGATASANLYSLVGPPKRTSSNRMRTSR